MDQKFFAHSLRLNYKPSGAKWSEANDVTNDPVARNFNGREMALSGEGAR